MIDERMLSRHEELTEKVGIFVKRILAKYVAARKQMLFQEKRDAATGNPTGIKEPLVLYINNSDENCEYPVQGITEVIVSLTEPPQDVIISNSKSRIKITFKVFLLVKYQDIAVPNLIVLPDDIGIKCMTQYDLSVPQHKDHGFPKETLQVTGGNFVYIIDIPLSEFDNTLTNTQLHDPTLQSFVLLKNLAWTVDVDVVGPNGTGVPPLPATTTMLSVYQDIVDKIGINQDIVINGIPEDFF